MCSEQPLEIWAPLHAALSVTRALAVALTVTRISLSPSDSRTLSLMATADSAVEVRRPLAGCPRAATQHAQPVLMAVQPKKVAVGVIGTGLVGAELLEQLEGCKEMLAKQGLDIKVASISKTLLVAGSADAGSQLLLGPGT